MAIYTPFTQLPVRLHVTNIHLYDMSSCFNGNWLTLYFQGNQSQHCNPNTESKRPSKPVNITPLCRLSPTAANHIQITWTPKYGQVRVIKSLKPWDSELLSQYVCFILV